NTPFVAAELDEELDVVEELLQVGAHAPACVRFGDEREEFALRRLAHANREAPSILALDEEERNLVIPNERDDLLALGERHAHLPEQPSRERFTAERVPFARDAPVLESRA